MAGMKSTVFLCLLLLPGLAGAATLREALDAASARAPSLRGLEAGRERVAAERYAADQSFPGTPVLGLGQREGQGGQRETELELATPLWLPGQRRASVALADARGEENSAARGAQRWALAGELRQRVAAARLAQAEVALLRTRLDNDRQLAAEVARRVQAGDLARADLLLARGEALAAESEGLAAESSLVRALGDYRVLTGLAALPTDAEEAAAAAPAEHPALAALRRQGEVARAGLELARRNRREAPELGVQIQRGRDGTGDDFRNSVRFGLRIPFAGAARHRPLLAAAQGELARVDAELAQAEAELAGEQATARQELAHALGALELADARRETAAERLRLLRRGFDLGELPLVQLLQARRQHNEAEAAVTRAGLLRAAAVARLNQALGVLP
jgi:cobalt-zinc-cadmium efflux system outer membrane protein